MTRWPQRSRLQVTLIKWPDLKLHFSKFESLSKTHQRSKLFETRSVQYGHRYLRFVYLGFFISVTSGHVNFMNSPLPITSWDPREIWRQYGRENSAYNWIWDNYRCYMCYLKVHLSAHASWPVYYSTHADLESSRGGNVWKFACLFFTLITIKCRSTSINSILRIFGMYFIIKFNSLKQI